MKDKSVKILKLKSSKMIDAIKNIDSGIVISTRIDITNYYRNMEIRI